MSDLAESVRAPAMSEPSPGSWLVCGTLTQDQLDRLPEDVYRRLSVYFPDSGKWWNRGQATPSGAAA